MCCGSTRLATETLPLPSAIFGAHGRNCGKCFGGCRPVSKDISVFSPLVIPFHGNRAARWMNRRVLRWSMRRVCRKLGFQNPITWTFVPSSADVAGSLGERLVIYHCVDEYSKFTGTDETAILEMERCLMEKADMVVVSSSRLYETKHRYNPNTFLVTHGVDVDAFQKRLPAGDCGAGGLRGIERAGDRLFRPDRRLGGSGSRSISGGLQAGVVARC